MPLYEYECEQCGARFEVIQRFSDPAVESCRVCSGSVHKLISPPAIQFKGTGWYITDYAKKDGSNPSAPAAASTPAPTSSAASSGETKGDSSSSPSTTGTAASSSSDSRAKRE